MKKLIFILSIIHTSLISANFDYLNITLKDDTLISGQLIGHYQEQWFWETESKNNYVALFVQEKNIPKIRVINQKEIKKSSTFSKNESSYNQFLKNHHLYFKGAPLKGWNSISTGNEGHHLYENMFGNFAWDFVKNKNGSTYKANGEKNEDYYVWDSSIYSPVNGTVADFQNEDIDHSPDLSHTSDLSKRGDGNYILIHVFDRFYVSLIHLKKGSIPSQLKVGSPIKRGDLLGSVGNSGITYVPHLHLTLFYWSEDLKRMISVPTFFSHVHFKSGPTTSEVKICEIAPRHGQQIHTLEERETPICPY